MKNFEDALIRIKALEEENANLQVKLKKALWRLNSSSVEEREKFTDIQVGEDANFLKIAKGADDAMKRFTEKNRRLCKKYREAKKDGK